MSSRSSRGGRLVLRVAAQPNSSRRHVFLGFGSCWERDQWAGWLQEVRILQCSKLDLTLEISSKFI